MIDDLRFLVSVMGALWSGDLGSDVILTLFLLEDFPLDWADGSLRTQVLYLLRDTRVRSLRVVYDLICRITDVGTTDEGLDHALHVVVFVELERVLLMLVRLILLFLVI